MTIDYGVRFGNMTYSRIDANQPEIVEALRKVGASVTSLADVKCGCPDLLVGFHGETYLLEVKAGPKARLTKAQVIWHGAWQGQVARVDTVDEALEAVGAI